MESFRDYIILLEIWDEFLAGEDLTYLVESKRREEEENEGEPKQKQPRQGPLNRFTHRTTEDWNKIWNSHKIPDLIMAIAREKFAKMVIDPSQIELKKLNQNALQNQNLPPKHEIWQAKIHDKWRALAVKSGNVFCWQWLGPRELLNDFAKMPRLKPCLMGEKTNRQQRPMEVR